MPYDLFVSYAHQDNEGAHAGMVTALVASIRREYEHVAGRPLEVFFDTQSIRGMDDWQQRILVGLRQSRIMLGVLSPAYFASDYCRLEWEEYLHHELAHALPGEGIAPIYVVQHPAFDQYDVQLPMDRWMHNLKRRQYYTCLDWWPQGQAALEQQGARQQIAEICEAIHRRLDYARRRDASPSNLPPYNPRFTGRVNELHQIREQLIRSQVGAIAAMNGLGGIGKSALALVYGHAYGHEYPGGRFWIDCSGLRGLRSKIIDLAAYRGLTIPAAERSQQPEQCWNRVKSLFEQGTATLFILDNLDDAELLSPASRRRSLPHGEHIHVLATSRLQGNALHGIAWLPVDSLLPEDGLDLLTRYRPLGEDSYKDERDAAIEVVYQLGGHALALEVVAVYLAEHPEWTYRRYRDHLREQGISLVEDTAKRNITDATALSLHVEQSLSELLAPTLNALTPLERLLVEHGALLPPDRVPIPWLAAVGQAALPSSADVERSTLADPLADSLRRLERMRLLVPLVDTPLGRMHRIVQEAVRSRLSTQSLVPHEMHLIELARLACQSLKDQWGPSHYWILESLFAFLLPRIDVMPGSVDLAYLTVSGLQQLGRTRESRFLCRRARRCASNQDNGDAKSRRRHFVAIRQLGDQMRLELHPRRAQVLYSEAIAVCGRVDGVSDVEYLGEAATLYRSSANLILSMSTEPQLLEAEALYEKAMRIGEALEEHLQGDIRAHRELAVTCCDFGNWCVRIGKRERAAALYEQYYVRVKQLHEQSPEDNRSRREYAVATGNLGNALMLLGEYPKAEPLLSESVALCTDMQQRLPGDLRSMRDLSVAYHRLGQLYGYMDRLLDSEVLYRRSMEQLFSLSGHVRQPQPDLDRAIECFVSLRRRLGYDEQETRVIVEDAARRYSQPH
ncbi:MAG: TIR domain-containing protein [Pirellulales bacterium]|nr:TIR domain-containing protein [Pirellulales bacterium]